MKYTSYMFSSADKSLKDETCLLLLWDGLLMTLHTFMERNSFSKSCKAVYWHNSYNITYTYIYIYVYIYIYILYIYTKLYTKLYMYIYIYIYTKLYIFIVYIYIYIYIYSLVSQEYCILKCSPKNSVLKISGDIRKKSFRK